MKKCPFCGKENDINAIKCSCGYYFDKSKYVETSSESATNQTKIYKNSSRGNFIIANITIIVFYIIGLISIIAGFVTWNNGDKIIGLSSIGTALVIIAFAEIIKILLSIEKNTRK